MIAIAETAMAHFAAAQSILEGLHLRWQDSQPDCADLVLKAHQHVEQSFWMSRLGQDVSGGSIAALPGCREIPLSGIHRRHIVEVRQGMLAADNCLASSSTLFPWNALLIDRASIAAGQPRLCFESGFLMRLFQLLEQARNSPPIAESTSACV